MINAKVFIVPHEPHNITSFCERKIVVEIVKFIGSGGLPCVVIFYTGTRCE